MYKIIIKIFVLLLFSAPAIQAQTITFEELEAWVKGEHDFGYLAKGDTKPKEVKPDSGTTTSKVKPDGVIKIASSWLKDRSLNIKEDQLVFEKTNNSAISSDWKLIPNGATGVKIQSVENPNHYIHCEGGVLQVGPIQPNWLSAYWILKPAHSGYNRIHSSWLKERYLHCEAGKLTLGQIQPNWASALWVLK